MITGDEFDIDVAAFFTIGMTALNFENANRSLKERLMGSISMKVTGAYSIAELARSDRFTTAQLPGRVILSESMRVIAKAHKHIAGRFVVVDAQRKVFESLYRPNGFSEIDIAEAPRGSDSSDFVTACRMLKDMD